jgi:Tfp pilus assembly protein PilV
MKERQVMSQSRRAFSFTEVLFAVMILGIGFIMVAAMFPVAIQQAKNNSEESNGAAVSRGAASYLDRIATNETMPPTWNTVVAAEYDGAMGSAQPDRQTIASRLRGSLIVASDSRVAWVPFYRRAGDPNDVNTWSPFAQVFMVPVYVRSDSQYKAAPVVVQEGQTTTAAGSPTGLPYVRATIRNGTNGSPDTITFRDAPQVASEGAYVIIADARGAGSLPNWDQVVAPDLQGRIYRLGNPASGDPGRGGGGGWELMPGFDYEPLWYNTDLNPATSATGRFDGKDDVVPGLTDVRVFVVGRGAAADGAAQDVAAYTTFVIVN